MVSTDTRLSLKLGPSSPVERRENKNSSFSRGSIYLLPAGGEGVLYFGYEKQGTISSGRRKWSAANL